MKTFTMICRILVGLVFVFSGFVKAVDPMGSVIKFNEYFQAYHMVFFQHFSLIFAIALCSLEFILGVALILGSYMRVVSWISVILMLFFTVQTFILAIWNPVTDCGCFGDAIKLTNWQTFYKNIILIVLLIPVFYFRKKTRPFFYDTQWPSVTFSFLFILVISLYGYLYKPLIDFRAYKTGNDILKLRTLPAGAHGDIYKSEFIYLNKKTGREVRFDETNLPMDTATWEYKDALPPVLISKGPDLPTKEFRFSDLQGNDYTDSFLQQKGFKLLILEEKLGETNIKAQNKIDKLTGEIRKKGDVRIYALTSSLPEEIKAFNEKFHPPYTFYTADPVLIKTIDRSNPALVLLKDNLIIKHWPARLIPDYDRFRKKLK